MSPDTTGDLGTILGVWGHPDDEAYLSAGLMATAVDAGRRVVCVTATRGEAGFPADDPRTVGQRRAVREREMADSLAVLGVREHRWLDYPDGRCSEVPDEEAAAAVAKIIHEVQPDTVLTFGPDGGTGHPDHLAACRWATLAFDRAAPAGARLLYSTTSEDWYQRFMAPLDPRQIVMVQDFEPQRFETSELAVWLICEGELLARKVSALRAQASQVEPFVEAAGLEFYSGMVAEEFYRERRPDDGETLERVAALKSW